ncbi:MAG: heme o synthase [Planctomycetes bacterium]|nr:heme o synthase [Planctomycetota bacterium]
MSESPSLLPPSKRSVLTAAPMSTGAPVEVLAPDRATPSEAQAERTCTTGIAASLWEATKPGITRLVTITALTGFAIGPLVQAPAERAPWLHTLILGTACAIGTYCCAAGANALNQWAERSRDALMPRTADRPIPSGRLSAASVATLGWVLTLIGGCVLYFLTGAASATVALLCTLVYVLLYTPMKTRTPWATHVGGIPGALPPLIGWAATQPSAGFTSLTQFGGWALFAIMFAWQIPHFLAIGWMYRNDYAAGGYQTLSVRDQDGRATANSATLWTMLLVVASLLPLVALYPLVSWPYAIIAIASGIWFFSLVWKFAATPDRPHARKVFFGSIIHMPVLFATIVAEVLIRRHLLHQ